jgi:hypothetical protein
MGEINIASGHNDATRQRRSSDPDTAIVSLLTGVIERHKVTHMNMVKTQVYLPKAELLALRRLARNRKRRIADLVRDAIRTTWLQSSPQGPVALSNGELRGTSVEHDAAFDEL